MPRDEYSLAHTVWNCKYHIVFAPKYRRQAFFGEKRLEIGKILRKLCEFKQVTIVEAEVCPDHIHMLVHVPPTSQLSDVIGHWKSYLATQKGIRFLANFFDTRIRDAVHYAEKWNYICQNPVARGLVEAPREWKYVIAFNPATGEEREHR